MGLKGDKHLMMSSIELPYETMKEIQISEGENYNYENFVILKCLSLKHAWFRIPSLCKDFNAFMVCNSR